MAVTTTSLHPRAITIRVIFVLVGLLLLGKAFHLQISSKEWTERATRVGESRQKLYPARGLIEDRNGNYLTINESIYQIEMTYNQFAKNRESFDTAAFCTLLKITPEYFENAIPKKWAPRYSKSKPFVFLPNVLPEEYARIQENLFRFPGFSASLRSTRSYPVPAAAHLLGYMGEVDNKAIENGEGRYVRGDFHGISGLEYQYEKILRGDKGERWLYRDRLGRAVGTSGTEIEAVVGANIKTTIDLDLQRYGERLMQNKLGTIIAIEPSTGEILTMISAPTYNPQNLQIGKNRGANFGNLQRDTLQPLLNRAINGKYAPGSPFKTLVALIAMENGTLDPDRGMACPGGFVSNGKMLTGCHAHPFCKNVEQAIANSCNNYFVTAWLENINRYGALSPKRGYDEFNDYLRQFGLGNKLGIDFPGEIAGFVPPSEYYEDVYQDDRYWRAIYLRSLAIGQGEYEMTSLQIANFTAAIANRGHWFTPHLVKEIKEGNEQVKRPVNVERHDIDIAPEHFERVVDGMRQTVTYGTARWAQTPGIDVCGKTGTVQNRKGEDHSAFTAFAPQNNPKIAILVYIENGGYGGTIAAPIASLMIEKYINGEIAPARKYLEKRMLEKDMTSRGESSIREVK